MSALLDLMIWIERKITDLHHYEAAGNLYTGFKERGGIENNGILIFVSLSGTPLYNETKEESNTARKRCRI
ncbi:hypothetical protein CHCC5027_0945 [Bacillus paralicheniformis]|nr:hypothetical protein CHCC5027_0945 [Bacillus paralicheniformis]